MKIAALLHAGAVSVLCLLGVLPVQAAMADAASAAFPLVGTWTLVAADVLHADGTRTRDYGAGPKGRLMIDGLGRYTLQIFKVERLRFAAGDKATGTPVEYATAVMGSSTHFGTISIDQAAGTLIFHIENASFPNWEGGQQQRSYVLKDDVLSYRVPPRPNGDTPISIWRRSK